VKVCLVAALAAVLVSPLAAQTPAPRTMSLTLAEALARADSTSTAVGIARAGVNRAAADVMRAHSSYLPQLSGSATYTRTLKSQFSALSSGNSGNGSETPDTFPAPVNCGTFHPIGGLTIAQRIDSLERGLDCSVNGSGIDFSKLPFGRANTWNFGLAASQTLFNGRLSGQARAAAAGRDQAEAALASERSAAVLSVAQAYYDAQLSARLAEIADSSLAQADRTLEETRLARQVGNLSEFDLLRATVARDNQRPVLIQRRSQRDQALLRLRQALRIPASTLLTLTTPLGDTAAVPLPSFAQAVAAAADTTVESRAPVRQAAAGLRASEGQLGSVKGARLPAVTLSSAFSKIALPEQVFSFGQFLTDWNVVVRMDVPLFTGGRTRADLLTATAVRDEAEERLREAREQATREQQDVQMQLDAARSAWDAISGTAAQAERAYAIAEVRYRNGLSTLNELADSRLQLEQALVNRAQAVRDLQVARVRAALLRDLPFGAGSTSASGPF
jgi:outer membrane protein TolC